MGRMSPPGRRISWFDVSPEGTFLDSDGSVLERHVLRYGDPCPGIQVPRGACHTCRCLEPGSVIFEAKDRPYDPERTEDLL